MMKKIGQYYATVFKKFGILIPVLGIAAAYVILILMERRRRRILRKKRREARKRRNQEMIEMIESIR